MRCSILALVLASAACTTHAPPQTPHTSGSADLERKTVALVQVRDAEARAYCSGVWVAPNAFLTAAHCVREIDPGDPVGFVTRDDLRADHADDLATLRVGELAARDDEHDLALVAARYAPEHGVASVSRDVYVGQSTQTMGHPLGLWWSYSTGTVSAVRMLDLGGEGSSMWWVQSTAPISPGNSGGGLFTDSGELIGIASAQFRRGQNLNVFVHAQYLSAFLESVSQ